MKWTRITESSKIICNPPTVLNMFYVQATAYRTVMVDRNYNLIWSLGGQATFKLCHKLERDVNVTDHP